MTERELFFRYLGLPSFTPMALDVIRAEGVFLYDRQGKEYMDMVSGISVSNIGHRHPAVLEAIRDQINSYLYLNVYGEFIQSPQVRLAERLTQLLPSSLDSVFFVNSGSEAVEGAIKLAKRFTRRTEIIAFRNAYHGSTQGALSICGNERLKKAFRPLIPDISFSEFNNFCDLERITHRTACVITETTMSEAGLIPPADGFLFQLRKRCDDTGSLLVIDDVQMGMGRTGHLFSFEPYRIVPDILVLAKAFGAGMPLGAFIAPKAMMNCLASNPELGHITTFGGHPVSCAAALAGLETLISGGHIKEADAKGLMLAEQIMSHPMVDCLRRKGLALGVDLKDEKKSRRLVDLCLQQGVIIDFYLFSGHTFRIAPPLTITHDEMAEGVRRIEAALSLL